MMQKVFVKKWERFRDIKGHSSMNAGFPFLHCPLVGKSMGMPDIFVSLSDYLAPNDGSSSYR